MGIVNATFNNYGLKLDPQKPGITLLLQSYGLSTPQTVTETPIYIIAAQIKVHSDEKGELNVIPFQFGVPTDRLFDHQKAEEDND
jgi:hypothetical protein